MAAPEKARSFSFDQPFPWSLLKLEILEKYSDTLAAIVGTNRRAVFVDVMAGEGYYSTGEDGSAGRLAEIAKRHRSQGRNVRVIAVEANAEAYERLESNTAGLRDFIQVRNADWREEVDTILEETNGAFVFFFVDPMGLEQIPWNDVSRLLARPSSEVLINFSSPTAARLAGIVLDGSRGHEKSLQSLEAAMGGASWGPGAEEARAVRQLPGHMAAAYAAAIEATTDHDTRRTLISKDGEAGVPKYHLVFASRVPRAFEIMHGIIASQRERLRRDAVLARHAEPMLMPFSAEDIEDAHADALINALASSLENDPALSGRTLTIRSLRTEALTTFGRFGFFREGLYRPAVTRLVDSGAAAVCGEDVRSGAYLRLDVPVRL